jgi:hypothetical protein
VIGAIVLTVLVLLPVHAAAWGRSIASLHAVNGVATGWLLAEAACASVEQPLVSTIPANDGLNTIGVVFLGAIVILVFVLARIECLALTTSGGRIVFPAVMLLCAASAWYANERSRPRPALT